MLRVNRTALHVLERCEVPLSTLYKSDCVPQTGGIDDEGELMESQNVAEGQLSPLAKMDPAGVSLLDRHPLHFVTAAHNALSSLPWLQVSHAPSESFLWIRQDDLRTPAVLSDY